MWDGRSVIEEGGEDGEGHTPCTINLLVGLLDQAAHCFPTAMNIIIWSSK